MTKFIKLTEVRKEDRKLIPLILNVDHINSVKQSDRGPDTHVNMKDNHYFFVKESLTEIEAKIETVV